MHVIKYPTEDPRGGLKRAWQDGFDREAARAEFRRTVGPRLRSLFLEINADVFGGRLPEPVIELADTPRRGVLGQCENRFWSWDETYRIVVRPEVVDGPRDELEAVVRHEVAHVAQWALGGKAGADEDAHGPVFRRMLGRIDEATGRRWVGKIDVAGEPSDDEGVQSPPPSVRGLKVARRRRSPAKQRFPEGMSTHAVRRNGELVVREPARVGTVGVPPGYFLYDEQDRYVGWERA